ncbi:unnamed protein product [Rotaria sordida]|nr:unnamed protein product [Rotaria sordida]
MYICPILIVCLIYIYIIRYTHQTIHIQQQRQIRNKRDLIILKRMVIIILIAMGIGIVTLFTWINYIITNYLIPIAYHLQGLSISSGFLMGSIGFAFITPQIYDILRIKQRQINPIIMIEVIH